MPPTLRTTFARRISGLSSVLDYIAPLARSFQTRLCVVLLLASGARQILLAITASSSSS